MRSLCFALIAMIAVTPFYQSAQTVPTGAIEGVVVRADTGVPVVGAQLTLAFSADGEPGLRATTPVPITTSADGRFLFKDLSAGNYRISVRATGFALQEYGQPAMHTMGRVVPVVAGQTVRNATIRLVSTGIVSGRVVDESGQPAVGAPVQIVRRHYNVLGPANQVRGTASVDDRGNYRVFDVVPGHYYVVAGTPPGPLPAAGARGRGSSTRFSMVYYPNAADFAQASMIEVKAGAENSVDMRIRRQPRTYSVRGRVVTSAGVPLPPTVNFSLVWRQFNLSGAIAALDEADLRANVRKIDGALVASYDPFTGVFELRDVVPGEYVLQVNGPVEGPVSPPQPAGGTPNPAIARQRQALRASASTAQSPLRVGDGNVTGVELVLRPAVSKTGRVVIEGRGLPPEADMEGMRLSFTPPTSNINQPPPIAHPPTADGTFRVDGLREGEYRLRFAVDLPDLYVKSLRYAGEDVLGRPFGFTTGSSGTFEVVLGTGLSQISGVVTDAQSRPVPGIQVVAIPAQRLRTDLYRPASTDQNGRFTLANLPPGEYKLFSWEAVENSAYFNPDFLEQYEQQAKTVILAESSNVRVDLKMISAAQ